VLARLARTSTLALIAAMIPPIALAQTYTTNPNFPINDTTTVYDGIGTVTPLPGGTSVLERVLYSIEQLNLSSPGAMAPVNGVYANIAESVLNREWYTTDRTEVAYEDYRENVVTPFSEPLTFARLASLPAGGSGMITLQDGTTMDVDDIVLGTLRVYDWAGGDGFGPPLAQTTAYTGAMELTLTVGDLGRRFTPERGTLATFFGGERQYDIRFNTNGSLELISVPTSAPTKISELVVMFEFAGELFRLDTVGNASGEPGSYVIGGASYNSQTDGGGSSSGVGSVATGILDTVAVLDTATGLPRLMRSGDVDAAVTAGTVTVANYDWTQVVLTDFTRQLDSFFDDWNQRNIATVIDGSVSNVISGVNATTNGATTTAALAVQASLLNIDIGDISTTALGAVNTGDITVGVQSAVDEAATSTTQAIGASLTVVGGSAQTGTMMLNIAHNTSVIRGNVDNTLIAMNGSVGDISTTALGAVNTGTITSGVSAAVQGIVGMSGVN
jgi:hypothetical protein